MKKPKFPTKREKLTPKQVKHIAKLAELTLSSFEVKKYQKQLAEILDYVEILQKVDTQKVEPTSQVTGLENVFRNDKTKACLSQKEVLANTPRKQNGFFEIKSIKEKWA